MRGSGSGRPFSDAAGAAAGLKERRGEEELVALAVWLLLLCFLFLLFFFSFFSFDRRGRRALLLLLLRRPPPARRRDGSRGRGQRAAPPDVLLPGARRGPLGVGFGRGDVRRRPGPASAAAVPNGVADAAFLFFFFSEEKQGFERFEFLTSWKKGREARQRSIVPVEATLSGLQQPHRLLSVTAHREDRRAVPRK